MAVSVHQPEGNPPKSSEASVSYRNMCRYNSRTFYKHELMQKYKWYWRVEWVALLRRSRQEL